MSKMPTQYQLYNKFNPSTADSTMHILNEVPNIVSSDLAIKKALLNQNSIAKKDMPMTY